jgi:hypothetical protein
MDTNKELAKYRLSLSKEILKEAGFLRKQFFDRYVDIAMQQELKALRF